VVTLAELAEQAETRRLELVVYGQPAPAGSKTAGRTADGRVFLRDASKGAAAWKRAVAQVAGEHMHGRELLEGPLNLCADFFLPRPKGHIGKRGVRPSAPFHHLVKPDTTKLLRAVEDALTGIVYRDDSQIVRQAITKGYGEPARVEIRIYQIREREWF
jgi:Holliday junction resolvase RusA-like endonuclease